MQILEFFHRLQPKQLVDAFNLVKGFRDTLDAVLQSPGTGYAKIEDIKVVNESGQTIPALQAINQSLESTKAAVAVLEELASTGGGSGGIADLSSVVNDLRSRIATLKSNVSALEEQNTTLINTANSLQSTVNTLTTDLSAASGQLASLQNLVNSANTKNAELYGYISSVLGITYDTQSEIWNGSSTVINNITTALWGGSLPQNIPVDGPDNLGKFLKAAVITTLITTSVLTAPGTDSQSDDPFAPPEHGALDLLQSLIGYAKTKETVFPAQNLETVFSVLVQSPDVTAFTDNLILYIRDQILAAAPDASMQTQTAAASVAQDLAGFLILELGMSAAAITGVDDIASLGALLQEGIAGLDTQQYQALAGRATLTRYQEAQLEYAARYRQYLEQLNSIGSTGSFNFNVLSLAQAGSKAVLFNGFLNGLDQTYSFSEPTGGAQGSQGLWDVYVKDAGTDLYLQNVTAAQLLANVYAAQELSSEAFSDIINQFYAPSAPL